MSETTRTAMLVERIRAAQAKARETSPLARFQELVDAGLITPDGKLRRDGSSDVSPGSAAAAKKQAPSGAARARRLPGR
jgi:hypothetical protein